MMALVICISQFTSTIEFLREFCDSKINTFKEEIIHILQFFFKKSINANQVTEIVNSVYGLDTLTVNHAQFRFRRCCYGNFHIQNAPRFEGLIE